jgi:hypothetical protein
MDITEYLSRVSNLVMCLWNTSLRVLRYSGLFGGLVDVCLLLGYFRMPVAQR